MAGYTDPGHETTERIIKEMEERLAKEYRQAYNELAAKLDDYLKRFDTKDRVWREWVKSGKKTKEEYKQWRVGQLAIGERWSEMKTSIAQDLHNVNEMARAMVRDVYMPEIYAVNHNYATFEVDREANLNGSYTLYDRDTVIRMMRDNPKLMPDPTPQSKVARDIAAGKDIAWNREHIQSAVMQSILQGESIDKMAKRIQSVTTADYNASVRYARTMATSAQNAGRYAAYQRAEDMGIDLSLVWEATLDERTRISHRHLDGEVRDVNEPFDVDGVQIYYPGDLGGEDYKVPGYLIWNCRCTIIAQVKGFEYNTRTDRTDYSQINGEYEDWLAEQESQSNPIDLPRDKQEAIEGAYIREYRGFPLNNVQSENRSGIMNGSNKSVRQEYHDTVSAIPKTIDPSKDLEQQARDVCWERNRLKIDARFAMTDREAAAFLDSNYPVHPFDWFVRDKMKRKGLTREEAYMDIIQTASKTNENVNKRYDVK